MGWRRWLLLSIKFTCRKLNCFHKQIRRMYWNIVYDQKGFWLEDCPQGSHTQWSKHLGHQLSEKISSYSSYVLQPPQNNKMVLINGFESSGIFWMINKMFYIKVPRSSSSLACDLALNSPPFLYIKGCIFSKRSPVLPQVSTCSLSISYFMVLY